jgi:hypothetical protein
LLIGGCLLIGTTADGPSTCGERVGFFSEVVGPGSTMGDLLDDLLLLFDCSVLSIMLVPTTVGLVGCTGCVKVSLTGSLLLLLSMKLGVTVVGTIG